MAKDAVFAYARLNARIMPMNRGELFEDPLGEALEKNGLGEVTGAGTMQQKNGEIEYCGIDLDLHDVDQAARFVCEFLTQHGAPKGSELSYKKDEQAIKLPFGRAEGLAIYLNGTDLSEEVYKQNDVNVVYAEINRLLAGRGHILGHWQGPRETALYMYGGSAAQMQGLIAEYVGKHPLCQKSRLVQIA